MNRRNAALRLIGLGWYVALCIVLGTVLGLWIDARLNTRPWLTIVGLLLGVMLAFYGVYRMLVLSLGEEEKTNNGENS